MSAFGESSDDCRTGIVAKNKHFNLPKIGNVYIFSLMGSDSHWGFTWRTLLKADVEAEVEEQLLFSDVSQNKQQNR